MITKLIGRRRCSEGLYTFYWARPNSFDYLPGQYIQLSLPHKYADARGIKRWFTLSSSPTESHLAITTAIASTAGSSFKKSLSALRPGQPVTISAPMGDFVLPQDASRPLIFIAGGLGVTPFRSMVKWLLDRHEVRPAQLWQASSGLEMLIFAELFERAPFLKYQRLVSRPPATLDVTVGRLTAQLISRLAKDQPRALVYLAGPEVMVEQLAGELKDLGLSADRTVTDYFPGYSAI